MKKLKIKNNEQYNKLKEFEAMGIDIESEDFGRGYEYGKKEWGFLTLSLLHSLFGFGKKTRKEIKQ